MNEELYSIARSHGITYFGVADLSKVDRNVVDQVGSGTAGYPYCISLGIVLPKQVVDKLPDRAEYANALNYKLFAYDVINQRLDLIASILSSFIQEKGYKVLPVPASGTVDNEKLCGSFSHKLGAHLCGFGWIGKNCLLITPENGPRVRWISILTDAPLEPTGAVMEEKCGDCTACADICPAQAIAGRNFNEDEPRSMRFDAHKCEAYFDSMKEAGQLDVCGLCLYACPHGRK